jgi:hypothetical protein
MLTTDCILKLSLQYISFLRELGLRKDNVDFIIYKGMV